MLQRAKSPLFGVVSIPTFPHLSAFLCTRLHVRFRGTIGAMKRTAILCLSLLLLAGCGSSGSTSKVACDQQYWNLIFAVCLPKDWRVLSKETLQQLGVPEETVAAFQYTVPHAGQLDTVTVTREPLAEDMKTPDYSNSNILAVSALPDYRLIDKETITIDGLESALHIFSARPSPDQPIRRYYQVSATKDKTGYTFTGSFPLSIQDSEADQVKFILKNVSFEDPKGAEGTSK